jgi:PNKP adenylyltransferase domain, ligase domain
MEMNAKLCGADTEILLATPFKIVDLLDEASAAGAVSWWVEMTAQGREGMAVKRLDFIAEGRRGITQPVMVAYVSFRRPVVRCRQRGTHHHRPFPSVDQNCRFIVSSCRDCSAKSVTACIGKPVIRLTLGATPFAVAKPDWLIR